MQRVYFTFTFCHTHSTSTPTYTLPARLGSVEGSEIYGPRCGSGQNCDNVMQLGAFGFCFYSLRCESKLSHFFLAKCNTSEETRPE